MRREDLAVHVKRENVFEDSYRELHRRSADEWKHRFYIVFEGMKFFRIPGIKSVKALVKLYLVMLFDSFCMKMEDEKFSIFKIW